MRRSFNVGFILGFIALVAWGCGGPMLEVSQKFEEGTDFGRLKTYAWMPVASTKNMQPGAESGLDVDGAVRAAVDKYLVVEGFALAHTNPDVLVKYHLGVRGTVYVSNFGMHYHEKVGWSESEIVDDGQLTVDLVDPTTQQVIWRGTAWGALNVDPNQAIVNKNTDRAVKKIFEQYPPSAEAPPPTGGY